MSIARIYVLAGADPVLYDARILAMQEVMCKALCQATSATVETGDAVVRISWGAQMVDATMRPPQYPRAEPETMLLSLRHLKRTNNRWTELASTGLASVLFDPGTASPTDKALAVLEQAVAWAAKRLGAPAPDGPAPDIERAGPVPGR